MTIQADRTVPIAEGLVAGLMGFSLIMLGWATESLDKTQSYLMINIGIVSAIVSVICFSYKLIIEINKERNILIITKKVLFWKFRTQRFLSDFQKVAIGTTRGQSQPSVGLRRNYIVVLLDKKGEILRLPVLSEIKSRALKEGEKVADYLNLPFDDQPHPINQLS